jgi:hypothetical protein
MTILVGVYLEDLSPLLGGGKAGEANVTDYTACFPVRLEDGTLIFELQRYNNNNQSPNTRGSLIALKQFGNEIKAKWLIGGYKSNLKVVGQERLFNYTAVEGVPSWDNGTASAMSGVATNSGWQYARPNMLRFVPQGGVKRRLTFALTGSVTIPAVSGSNVEVTFDANAFGESTDGAAAPTATVKANGAITMTDSAFVVRGDEAHPIVYDVAVKYALPKVIDFWGNATLTFSGAGTYNDGMTKGTDTITMHPGTTVTSAKASPSMTITLARRGMTRYRWVM